jgi:hypothetical protein
MMIAGLLTAMLLGSVSMTLSRLSRAKMTSKERLDAHMRADAALREVRRDIVSIIRTDDLFFTRFVLTDVVVNSPIGDLNRDELMMFTNHLRPSRSLDYNGEGMEYETHYRVHDEGPSSMLWRRRDAMPDEYEDAGGVATPLVENIIELEVQAYDGYEWLDEWDSDYDGIPHAVRVAVVASGARPGDLYEDATLVALRTVVAIDRVLPPSDLFRLTEEELAELDERVFHEPPVDTGEGGSGGLGSDGGTGNGDGGRGGEGGRGGRGGGGGRGGEGGGGGDSKGPPGVARPVGPATEQLGSDR